TTETPFCASSFASTPPPAPVPITTTTLSSLRSKGAAMILSPSEPRDVVEAALDVAALRIALALVAEERPDLLLVVEPGHQPAAHLLEEGRGLHAAHDRHPVRRPRHRRMGGIPRPRRRRIERRDPRLDRLRLLGGVI